MRYVGEATLEDIKPGVKLWHSFGNRKGGVDGFTVMTFPATLAVLDAHRDIIHNSGMSSFWFDNSWIIGYDDAGNLVHHSINDCGLGEYVYNNHRLFLTEEDAIRHNESFTFHYYDNHLDDYDYYDVDTGSF